MQPFIGLVRQSLAALGIAFVTLASTAAWGGPPTAVLDHTHASVKAAVTLQSEVTPDLMKWPDVLGTAIGLSEAGQPSLVVFVDRDGASHADVVRALPPALRGIAVRAELSDTFRIFGGKPGGSGGGATGGISHSVGQALPIQLGTSGGWRYDLANGYCCGVRWVRWIQVNGVQYILSNYHVLGRHCRRGNNLVAHRQPHYRPV
jgi:hypothetical protein